MGQIVLANWCIGQRSKCYLHSVKN